MASEETQIAILKTQMDNFEKKLDIFIAENKEAHKELLEMIVKTMDKKAGRWVENVIYSVAGVVGLAFLGLLVYKVFGIVPNL